MIHTKQLAGGAAGVVVTMSLLAFAPNAFADGSDLYGTPSQRSGQSSTDSGAAGTDSGAARNDIRRTTIDPGAARNNIGDFNPGGPSVPIDNGPSTDAGTSTQDLLIGTAAGLLAVGGGAAAAISIRRRNAMAHHPA
jgi:hypothetical protein